VDVITSRRSPRLSGLRNVLVIGASTGYGLASRIAAAWGFGARTVGVFFERPPEGIKTASAGYYNTVAFHELARRDRLHTASLNADAFSNQAKSEAIEIIRRDFAPIDLIVYAWLLRGALIRTPVKVFNSALKPIGQPFFEQDHRARFGKSSSCDAGARKQ